MPDLILHIGWHKTGSSALQSFLCDTDLRDHSLTYLRKGPRRPAYNTVQFGLTNPDRLATDQSRLRDQVVQLQTKTAIISAEVFSTLPPAFVAQWLSVVDWDRIRIVAYLRRQDMYLESLYKQGVKWGHDKGNFKNFLEAFDFRKVDYAQALKGWAETFPKAQIVPRVYEPNLWIDGIVTDFCEVIGVPAEVSTGAGRSDRNVSPSAELTNLYRQIDGIENLQKVNRKVIGSGVAGVTGNEDCLTLTDRQTLLDRFSNSNEEVRRLYFPYRSTLFEPPTTGSNPTEFDKNGAIAAIIDAIAYINGPEAALRAQTSLKGNTL